MNANDDDAYDHRQRKQLRETGLQSALQWPDDRDDEEGAGDRRENRRRQMEGDRDGDRRQDNDRRNERSLCHDVFKDLAAGRLKHGAVSVSSPLG